MPRGDGRFAGLGGRGGVVAAAPGFAGLHRGCGRAGSGGAGGEADRRGHAGCLGHPARDGRLLDLGAKKTRDAQVLV